jgi:hypothetical protein
MITSAPRKKPPMPDTCMGDCLAHIFDGDGEAIQRYLEHDMLVEFSWWQRLDYWLEGHGMKCTTHYWITEQGEAPFPLEVIPAGPFIAIGQSPRGGRHAIVVSEGKMLYDPDSSNTGLVEIEYIIGFELITQEA